MKTGVIDVGGGLRGIYASGVLDYCIDNDIHFDLGIGISAGSANIASYAAGQRGRNYQFYIDYSFRKQYMSLGNFIRNGSYVDVDYIYGTLSNSDGENPLDYKAICENPMEFYIVAENAHTGMTKYFDKSDIFQDDYSVFKASSSIPFVCKPYKIKGEEYFDGALGDCVPLEKAFQLGCDRVVLILTKPVDVVRVSHKDDKIAALIRRKYPLSAKNLCRRAKVYNESVAKAKEYAKEGKVLIIAPDDTCGVDTLKRDRGALQRLYDKGYKDGKKIADYLNNE